MSAEEFAVQIREIPIEIDVVGVGASGDPASSGAGFGRFGVTVGVHRGHDVNPSGRDQLDHFRILGQVFGAKIVDEFQQKLATDHFVAVHVADVSGNRKRRK